MNRKIKKSNRKQRSYRNRTIRRMNAGAPLNQRQINADSNELKTLVKNKNLEVSRVENLSPYATYNHNYLLMSFVLHILKWNTDESVLMNIIERTVDQQDPVIFNEDIVSDVVEILLEHRNTFNQSMIKLLKSIPPIRNVRILNSLYNNVIKAFNPFVFEALVDAGHVPLTKDQYEDIKSIYRNSHGYRFCNGGPCPGDLGQRFKHMNRVIKKIRPSAQTDTANLLHSINQHNINKIKSDPQHQNIELTAENVEELYSHLNAIAEDSHNKQINEYNIEENH